MDQRWDEPPAKRPGTSQTKQGSKPAAALDPYFRWAQHTGWRGMMGQAGWDRQPGNDDLLQIVGCIDDPSKLEALAKTHQLRIPPTYLQCIPGTEKRARYFTAWIRRSDFDKPDPPAYPFRWVLSQPRRDAEKVARGSAMGYYGPQRSLVQFRASNVLKEVIRASRDKEPPEKPGDVIAVIDFGCPFLNERFSRFQKPTQTRIAALWDQGSEVRQFEADDRDNSEAWPWAEPQAFGYGREIRPQCLAPMVESIHSAGGKRHDENEAYRGIDYLIDYDDPRRRVWYSTHGAHVLDVAGGATDPLTQEPDDASEASLVFVQLPSMTAGDSSGASLAGHLLDGVRYVLDRSDDDARIVVNISYGSQAGPHDGHSMIEEALQELLEARDRNFAIVLAAGNSRRLQCHARREVHRERSALLRCLLAAGDTTDSFVEIWYQPPPEPWLLRTRARPPNRQWSPWVAPGKAEAVMRDLGAKDEIVAMLRHDKANVPNGNGLALVLLAMAPTQQPAGVPCATVEAGLWEIEVELHRSPDDTNAAGDPPAVVIHARIERDDPGQSAGAGLSRFLDQDFHDDRDTLSSLASGRHTIVAGGFRRSDRREADYSAIGPQRDREEGLMVLAVCEEDDVNPNIAATAVRSGEVFRMNGTSVAAPVLARRLFILMKECDVIRSGWKSKLDGLVNATDGVVRHSDG